MVQSTLVTPEPYRVPGYLGYVPQFKFKIGGTYGKTTHNILYSPNATKTSMPYKRVDDARFIEPLARTNPAQQEGWNNTKLKGTMVPGYTGYIPKGQQYFGQCYAKSCDNALQSFEKDLVAKERNDETIKFVPRTLMSTGASGTYPPKARQFEYGTSPYKLPSRHPDKFFVSGYTGFVPRSRDLLAKSFPELTHEALNIHQAELENSKRFGDPTRRMARAKTAPTGALYPIKSGIIPNYTGHIPAMKFKYGRTYGSTTVNVLNQSI